MPERSATAVTKPATLISPQAGLLQRKCACGAQSHGNAECSDCAKKRHTLQRKLSIGASNDPLEAEADRVADQVMAPPARATAGMATPRIQRYAAHAGTDTDSEMVPASVDRVLASSGRPLDHPLRQDMEQRFGHDFSRVRVHTDGAAQESARAVGALAYTVGDRMVFAHGQYQPHAASGRRLLAHELAHTVQQGMSPLRIQRACLSAVECAKPRATLTDFVDQTEKKPENVAKQAKRAKACKKTPPAASCTADGHGAKATALTALLSQNYKSRLGYIDGIFVDKDMPAAYGADTYTKDSGGCAAFLPTLAGDNCTTVPDVLEAQAKAYLRGDQNVGGLSRANWLADAMDTLTHETEHARFEAQPAIARPSATACKFEDLKDNLSELAATLSEMHVQYRAALAKPDTGRFSRFNAMFPNWVNNSSESIAGIATELRCKCECTDADHYIVKTSESVSGSQKWDSEELRRIHTQLGDTKWKLNWPVAPPASVNATDLPLVTAVPFKLE